MRTSLAFASQRLLSRSSPARYPVSLLYSWSPSVVEGKSVTVVCTCARKTCPHVPSNNLLLLWLDPELTRVESLSIFLHCPKDIPVAVDVSKVTPRKSTLHTSPSLFNSHTSLLQHMTINFPKFRPNTRFTNHTHQTTIIRQNPSRRI